MVSTYGYITVADLELFSTIDYSDESVKFTDESIEANITQAEIITNIYCEQTFTGTIPLGVLASTKELAKRLMQNRMIYLGTNSGKNLKKEDTMIENDSGLMSFLKEYNQKRTIWWK